MTIPLPQPSPRHVLIADRIRDRVRSICKAVPPIEPPAVHWLNSDASASYCWECAHIARGREFELGPLLKPADWWFRDDWERAFYEGIDGGFDGESDHTEACSICRRTLSYILTDYGFTDEVDHFRQFPLTDLRDEDSYALDRMTLNVWEGTKRRQLLDVAIIVNQAYRLIPVEEA